MFVLKYFFPLFLISCFLFAGCSEKKENIVQEKHMKTIIFDFDGTIVDTLHIVFKCLNKSLIKIGYKPIEELGYLKERNLSNVIKESVGWNHFWQFWKIFTLNKLGKIAKKCLNKEAENIKPFDGIKEVLEKLSQNYRVVIITSNLEEVVENVLNKYGIKLNKEGNNKDYIFSSSSISGKIFGKHKVIEEFLKQHGLNKDEIIYVGDEIRDIQACKKIGVEIIAVCWGYNSKKFLEKEKPDYLIDKPEELLKILKTA